jgi:hypothetical protein
MRRRQRKRRRGDDFVPGADARGEEREVQRAGPGVDADAVAAAVECGELVLEGSTSRPRMNWEDSRVRAMASSISRLSEWYWARRSAKGTML